MSTLLQESSLKDNSQQATGYFLSSQDTGSVVRRQAVESEFSSASYEVKWGWHSSRWKDSSAIQSVPVTTSHYSHTGKTSVDKREKSSELLRTLHSRRQFSEYALRVDKNYRNSLREDKERQSRKPGLWTLCHLEEWALWMALTENVRLEKRHEGYEEAARRLFKITREECCRQKAI